MALRRLAPPLVAWFVTTGSALAEPAGPTFAEGTILSGEAPLLDPTDEDAALVQGSTPSTTAPAPSGYVPRPPPPKVPVAIGVNLPLRWEGAGSVAGSVSVGLSKEHAVKANLATYENVGPTAGNFASSLAGEDGDEASHSGRTTDVGISFVHFPRRLWSGFSYEAGVLFRSRDLRTEDSYATPVIKETNTKMVGGRVMIGWSWLMADHVFVAFGVGLSMGYERGSETTENDPLLSDPMRTTTDVSRPDLNGEGYLRLGGAFDL